MISLNLLFNIGRKRTQREEFRIIETGCLGGPYLSWYIIVATIYSIIEVVSSISSWLILYRIRWALLLCFITARLLRLRKDTEGSEIITGDVDSELFGGETAVFDQVNCFKWRILI